MARTIQDSQRYREMVERALRSVLPATSSLPGDEEDWIQLGWLDSMAHVEVLMHIERAAGVPDLFARAGVDPPVTMRDAIAAVQIVLSQRDNSEHVPAPAPMAEKHRARSPMTLTGWGSALGSQQIPIAQVEKEFGLPAGKLSQGAALEAVCRVSKAEDEISLAREAAQQAFDVAGVSESSLDWILATSETVVGFPSLGASLHSALLAPQTCGVLDIGGGCAGVVNSLIVADALFAAGKAACVLAVSADVHSRTLVPGKVPGEFGGLFGDGASAIVMRPAKNDDDAGYRFVTGMGSCVGTYASAIQVRPGAGGAIDLGFDGEALAHAAVDRMAMVVSDLEIATGQSRDTASAFVIHQPNPRVVEIFIRRAKLPPEKLPIVTRATGNLGSSTCGLGLCTALEEHGRKPRSLRGPIFLAALGPGLLWSGAVLE